MVPNLGTCWEECFSKGPFTNGYPADWTAIGDIQRKMKRKLVKQSFLIGDELKIKFKATEGGARLHIEDMKNKKTIVLDDIEVIREFIKVFSDTKYIFSKENLDD